MGRREVKLSLNRDELECFSSMCNKQLDCINRSLDTLKSDDTSYNSFERMRLEEVLKMWRETERKILNSLEVVTTINESIKREEDGECKVVDCNP